MPCANRVYKDIGVGPLVSSQERRAVSSGGQNGRQPVVNRWFGLSIGLHRISFGRASETFRTVVYDALEGTPRGRWRSSTQSSAPEIEDAGGFVDLRSRRSKMGGSSIFGVESRRLKIGGVLRSFGSEDRGRGSSSILGAGRSKNPPLVLDLRSRKIEEPPVISIFRAEDRRTPPLIFNLRSSALKIEEPPLSYLRPSAPKIEEPRPSSIFGPEEWVKDRTEDGGGVRLLRRWGGSSKIGGVLRFLGSDERSPPNFHFLSFPRTKDPPHLPLSRLGESKTLPPGTFSSDAPFPIPVATSCSQLS